MNRQRIISLVMLYIILFSLMPMPFAAEDDVASDNENQFSVQSVECSTLGLSPKEIEKLKQELYLGDKPFNATSNKLGENDPNKDKLENAKIVVLNKDGKTGTKQDLPQAGMKANEIDAFLDKYCDGPYSFGVQVDDTIRLSRCTSKGCWLQPKAMTKRNSDDSIVGSVFDFQFSTDEELYDYVTSKADGEVNENQTALINYYKREDSAAIKNYISTLGNSFEVEMSCDNCSTYIYSAFDKYFNKATGIGVAVTGFGPIFASTFKPALKHLGSYAKEAGSAVFNKVPFNQYVKGAYNKLFNLLGEDTASIVRYLDGEGLLSKTQNLVRLTGKPEAEFVSLLEEQIVREIKTLPASKIKDVYKGIGKIKSNIRVLDNEVQNRLVARTLDLATPAGKEEAASIITSMKGNADLLEGNIRGINPEYDVIDNYLARTQRFRQAQGGLTLEINGAPQPFERVKELLNTLQSEVPPPNVTYTAADIATIRANNLTQLENVRVIAANGVSDDFLSVALGRSTDLRELDFLKGVKEHSKTVTSRLDSIYSKIKTDAGLPPTTYSAIDEIVNKKYDDALAFFNPFPTYQASSLAGVSYFTYYLKTREGISHYMVPQSWQGVRMYQGVESVYYDSYVDIFSNEGSNPKDLFEWALQSLPVVWFATTLATLKPIEHLGKPLLAQIFGKLKKETKDLYSVVKSTETCNNCGFTISRNKNDSIAFTFKETNPLTSYVLEANNDILDTGLITYAHHTNLVPFSQADPEFGQPLNIAVAQKAEETCAQKLDQLPLGVGTVSKFTDDIGLEKSKYRAGVVTALGESFETLGYMVFGLGGIAFSIARSNYLAHNLGSCVDDQEGYYVHFTMYEEFEEETANKQEEVLDYIGTIKKNLTESAQVSDELKPELLKNVEDKVSGYLDNNEPKDKILQLTAKTHGPTLGHQEGEAVYWFNTKGTCTASKYKDTGKDTLIDANSGKTVEIDSKDGTVKVDGKSVVSNPDLVRLTQTNIRTPAKVLPNSASLIPLDGSKKDIFNIDASGNVRVLDDATLECIKSAIMNQMNISLNSDLISSKLGNAKIITTENYSGGIFFNGNDISAEGNPRQVVGKNGEVVIRGDRESIMKPGNIGLGKLVSIEMENAVILYKPGTNALLLWFYNLNLDKDAVDGINIDSTSINNPETDCPEPAINLDLIGGSQDPEKINQLKEFNQGIEKIGPIQVIDGQDTLIAFYSKLVDGACKDFIRVYDKKTGQVTDQEITNVSDTADGIKVTTADGTEHTINIKTSDDGRPILEHNGDLEAIRSMQGAGGALWYDPETGQWYVTNGHLMNMDESFKKGLTVSDSGNGALGLASPGFAVSETAVQPPGLLASLPSIPEGIIGMTLFVLVALIGFSLIGREEDE